MLSEAHANGVGFFDKLVPAYGPGFAAFLRKCPRVIVYLPRTCHGKYIFNSACGAVWAKKNASLV